MMLVASVTLLVAVFLVAWSLFLYVAIVKPQRDELREERRARIRAEENAKRSSQWMASVSCERLRRTNKNVPYAERFQTIKMS